MVEKKMMTRVNRKPVMIAACQAENGEPILVVLANDGTMWVDGDRLGVDWRRLESLPQPAREP